jgi:hypothetical protein
MKDANGHALHSPHFHPRAVFLRFIEVGWFLLQYAQRYE